MREERVVLEEVAAATHLGRHEQAGGDVGPHLPADRDAALPRAREACDDPQERGLPGARRAGEGKTAGGHVERQRELEVTQRDARLNAEQGG
jgi:hypothetical protein